MARYLPYSRRELRVRFATRVKRNSRPLLILLLGAIGLVALTSYLLLGVGDPAPWSWYLLGLMHATIVAIYIYALWSTYITFDQEAIFHLRGAWGEENTRDILKQARRKKLIWGWVDSVSLQFGDIDHLVVTRSGGLIAMDSKWRNNADATGHELMVQSARKTKLRAEGVMQSLLKRERGGHRASVNPLAVRPVIVVWGALAQDIPVGAAVAGVNFVGGLNLIAWLRDLNGEPVSRDAARDLITRLEAFRETAWSVATK